MPKEHAPETLSPTIDQATIAELAEISERNHVERVFQGIVEVQPELGRQMDNYIGHFGRDSEEKQRLKKAVMLTCLFLEAQAEDESNIVNGAGSVVKRSGSGIIYSMYLNRAPDDTLLPVVDNPTMHKTLANLGAQPGLIDATYWRVIAPQPELGQYVESGPDAAGRELIKQAMAIPYLLLEAQAEADRTKLLKPFNE